VNEDAGRHIGACERFGEVLALTDDRWDAATPCTDWDVRDVVEHVIGFHDVLLLRPLSAKPDRPRDDPLQRWNLTVEALREVLVREGLFDSIVEVPAIGNNPSTTVDARGLIPSLTQDVIVHTWDVARAIDVDDHLDNDVCSTLLARLPDDGRLERSGMYASPVPVPVGADPRSKLLARLGRDPRWTHS